MKFSFRHRLSLLVAIVPLATASPASAQLNTRLISNLPLGARNGEVWAAGNYAYVARGHAGLAIIDTSNPAAPCSIGQYDPEPGSGSAFVGGYSVFPTANNIYLSHTSGGLYTIDSIDTIPITKAGWRKNSKVLVVEATSTGAGR